MMLFLNESLKKSRMENEINIRVKTLDGRELNVKSSRNQSVGDFKNKIQEMTQIQPGNQRIIYQG